MHIPERFLDPVGDKRLKMTKEECLQKVEKMVLPKPKVACLAHELKNGPTKILMAAIWLKLKCKYFKQGMVKEACKLFHVQAKQLSRVLTSRKYLGSGEKKGTSPKTRGKKRKSVPLAGAKTKTKTKEEEEDNDDNNYNTTHQKVKDRPH